MDTVQSELLSLLEEYSKDRNIALKTVSSNFNKIISKLPKEDKKQYNLVTYILTKSVLPREDSTWRRDSTVNEEFNHSRLKTDMVTLYNVVLKEMFFKTGISEDHLELLRVPEEYRRNTERLVLDVPAQLALIGYYLKLRANNRYDNRLTVIPMISKYVENPLILNMLYIMIFESSFGCHGKFFDPSPFFQDILRQDMTDSDREVLATLSLWFANPTESYIKDVYGSIEDKNNAAFLYSRTQDPEVRVYLTMKFGGNLEKPVVPYDYSTDMWEQVAKLAAAIQAPQEQV